MRCAAPDCTRTNKNSKGFHSGKKLCDSHRKQMDRHKKVFKLKYVGTLGRLKGYSPLGLTKCSLPSCLLKHEALGLCKMHYTHYNTLRLPEDGEPKCQAVGMNCPFYAMANGVLCITHHRQSYLYKNHEALEAIVMSYIKKKAA